MELINWGKVLGDIIAGVLVVCGTWALVILAFALLRRSAGSTATLEHTGTVLQKYKHPHNVTTPPVLLDEARNKQPVSEQSA